MTTRLPPRSIQTHAGSTAPHSYLFNVQDPFLLNLILDDRKRIKKSRIDGVSFLLSQLETNEQRRVSLRTAAEQTNAFFSFFLLQTSPSLLHNCFFLPFLSPVLHPVASFFSSSSYSFGSRLDLVSVHGAGLTSLHAAGVAIRTKPDLVPVTCGRCKLEKIQ